MVTEMTSLQGIIGGEYALRSGEAPEVAGAIGEQYQAVPQSKIGLMVALTDRLDSLVGLFAAGLAPTGAKDPFALRRAAIGTVQPLIEHDLDFDLREAVARAAKLQPIEVSEKCKSRCSISSLDACPCCSRKATATMWSMRFWRNSPKTRPPRLGR